MKDDKSERKFNLVWMSQGLGEADWIRHLLRPLICREIVAERYEFIEPGSLYVVGASGAKSLQQIIPPSFLAALRNVKCKGLVHAGDEYYAGGYEVYRQFDFVLRQYHTALFNHVPEVLTFPLGWAEGTPQRSVLKPVEARKYLWSFLGNQTASSRPEMLKALRRIEPQFVYCTAGPAGFNKISRSEYHALLDDTVFAPCPMGNAVMETWRFYEALEAGCIPIIEARPWMRYHERLLGPHPVPVVYGWPRAARLINDLSKDQARLRTLQQSIVSWWEQCKKRNETRIVQFINEESGKQASQLPIRHLPSTSPWWPMRQTIELLRHQSAMSMVRRLSRPLGRLVSKVRSKH
jgi:hypothetical protein